MGVDGVVVMLKVVHMDAGGAVYSSHWPCRSAPYVKSSTSRLSPSPLLTSVLDE